MALKEEVMGIISRKLQAMGAGVPEDEVLQDSIDETELCILNYCNISLVPPELKFVWTNLTVDYLRWLMATANENHSAEETSSGNTFVSSINEGDVSVSFLESSNSQTTKNSAAHDMNGALDNLLLNYESALNRFRKVVW